MIDPSSIVQAYTSLPPIVQTGLATIATGFFEDTGKELSSKLKKMIETWVEAHEQELLEQWENAKNNQPVKIVG